MWLGRRAKSLRRVETLVRRAADRIGWDGDIVWGHISETLQATGEASHNAQDQHFGYSILWDGQEVDVYMYAEA